MRTNRLVLGLACLVSLLGSSFNQANPQPAKNEASLAQFDIVDLTHPLKEGMPVFPGGEPFKLTKLADFNKSPYYLNKISLGEHCGTHVDAPKHFFQDASAIDKVPLSRLIGPLVIIDVTKEATAKADYEISVDDVRRWEKSHGAIPKGAFVLGNSGWWTRWDDPKTYINLGADEMPHFPGFSALAARILVDERKVAGLGMDTLSIDPGIAREFPAHRVVLKAEAINIENLANLGQVPAHGAVLVVAPLRIANGSGAPARVFALVPKGSLPRQP